MFGKWGLSDTSPHCQRFPKSVVNIYITVINMIYIVTMQNIIFFNFFIRAVM